MTREDSPEARRLLDRASEVILAHGVAGLSLSQLSRAIGSNNRMLLYYFDSKDVLFARAIYAAYDRFPALHALIPGLQEQGDLVANIRTGWRRLRDEENLPYISLFFEAFTTAVRDPEENRAHLGVLATHWPEGIHAAFAAHGYSDARAATATVQLMALWRGLQLALLSGVAAETLDEAHDDAVDRLFGARSVTA